MYSSPLFRPPSEAYSAIIQATEGCSHNKCSFCSMYKTKKFFIKPWPILKEHIDLIALHYPQARKIFIADGNALVMPTEQWLVMLDYLKNKFTCVEQISCYATPKDILNKSSAELIDLKNHGLKLLYMGIESGNDVVLNLINKGVTAFDIIHAGKKAIDSGLILSVTIITGLSDTDSYKHALDTAKVVSEIQPHYIGMLSLMLEPGSQLYNKKIKGEFTPPSALQCLYETKIFLENAKLKETIFRSNHASNYFSLSGILDKDKHLLIDQVCAAMSDKTLLKPDFMRGL